MKKIYPIACAYLACLLVFSGCGWNDTGSTINSIDATAVMASSSEPNEDELCYTKALMDISNGDYESAIVALESLDNYGDSAERLKECYYNLAVNYERSNDYDSAMLYYEKADDYRDATDQYTSCRYNLAVAAIQAETWDKAIELLSGMDFKDSKELLEDATMQKGMHECSDYDFISALESTVENRMNTPDGTSFEEIVNAELGRLQDFKNAEYYNEYIAFYANQYITGVETQKDALSHDYSEFQIMWQEGLVARFQVISWLHEYFGVFEDNQEVLDQYVYQLESEESNLAMLKTVDADLLSQMDGKEWDLTAYDEIGYPYTNNTEYSFTLTFYFYFYDADGTRLDDEIVTYEDIRPGTTTIIKTYCPVDYIETFDFYWEIFE